MIAEQLSMEKEVVRVWFCNRRQKEKRINCPVATPIKSPMYSSRLVSGQEPNCLPSTGGEEAWRAKNLPHPMLPGRRLFRNPHKWPVRLLRASALLHCVHTYRGVERGRANGEFTAANPKLCFCSAPYPVRAMLPGALQEAQLPSVHSPTRPRKQLIHSCHIPMPRLLIMQATERLCPPSIPPQEGCVGKRPASSLPKQTPFSQDGG